VKDALGRLSGYEDELRLYQVMMELGVDLSRRNEILVGRCLIYLGFQRYRVLTGEGTSRRSVYRKPLV
jgi:hypothetical protein